MVSHNCAVPFAAVKSYTLVRQWKFFVTICKHWTSSCNITAWTEADFIETLWRPHLAVRWCLVSMRMEGKQKRISYVFLAQLCGANSSRFRVRKNLGKLAPIETTTKPQKVSSFPPRDVLDGLSSPILVVPERLLFTTASTFAAFLTLSTATANKDRKLRAF